MKINGKFNCIIISGKYSNKKYVLDQFLKKINYHHLYVEVHIVDKVKLKKKIDWWACSKCGDATKHNTYPTKKHKHNEEFKKINLETKKVLIRIFKSYLVKKIIINAFKE